ncbi:MAG TPA: site-specific integrase [Thermoleophilaceae bacterium]|jgi:integrase
MSVQKVTGGYEVRWYEGGRGSRRRSRAFRRRRDAELFDAEITRRKALGELSFLDAANTTMAELVDDWWKLYAKPNLALNTLNGYAHVLDRHVIPRLGSLKVRDVTPEVLARFRADLEQAGVGRHAVRVSLVVLQAVFRRAEEWGRVQRNPVRAVPKPSGRRERTIVCLAPAQVESLRSALLDQERHYAALIVSLAAYAGLRIPQEVLALEWSHVRERTLLVDQRNIDGQITPGQKVRHFRARAVDLVGPLRQDLAEYRLRMGRPSGLLFPRRDGAPWRRHDFSNWRRRVWHPAREAAGIEVMPPYDLRHAFASLQIRAGLSIPELAEQLGHSPHMTLSTYAHVMRELKGLPARSAEDQIEAARGGRGRLVDGEAATEA